MFGIPKTTLSSRLLTMDLESLASKPTILSKDEENSLVGHILEMEERGFGLTITDVCKLAYSIMAKSGRKNPFNEEKRKWQDMIGGKGSEIGINVYPSVNLKDL